MLKEYKNEIKPEYQENKDKVKERKVKYYQDNKKYASNYKYWCRTSPIGILSRAYFHELNKHNEN